MDATDCDPDLLADALDMLAEANRRFGGLRTLFAHVDRVLGASDAGGQLRILDVGAGGGESATALGRSLGARGRDVRLVFADLHAGVIGQCRARVRAAGGEVGRRAGYVRLDGAALPFADDAFDLAFSTATLHHLDDRGAARFLREIDRVSRVGWVVVDMRRSRAALLSVRFLAATRWRRHPYPRADGPVSVRRSFTVREIRRLLDELGLDCAVVRGRIVRWVAWRAHAGSVAGGRA